MVLLLVQTFLTSATSETFSQSNSPSLWATGEGDGAYLSKTASSEESSTGVPLLSESKCSNDAKTSLAVIRLLFRDTPTRKIKVLVREKW